MKNNKEENINEEIMKNAIKDLGWKLSFSRDKEEKIIILKKIQGLVSSLLIQYTGLN
jgi:hypothetical protein